MKKQASKARDQWAKEARAGRMRRQSKREGRPGQSCRQALAEMGLPGLCGEGSRVYRTWERAAEPSFPKVKAKQELPLQTGLTDAGGRSQAGPSNPHIFFPLFDRGLEDCLTIGTAVCINDSGLSRYWYHLFGFILLFTPA